MSKTEEVVDEEAADVKPSNGALKKPKQVDGVISSLGEMMLDFSCLQSSTHKDWSASASTSRLDSSAVDFRASADHAACYDLMATDCEGGPVPMRMLDNQDGSYRLLFGGTPHSAALKSVPDFRAAPSLRAPGGSGNVPCKSSTFLACLEEKSNRKRKAQSDGEPAMKLAKKNVDGVIDCMRGMTLGWPCPSSSREDLAASASQLHRFSSGKPVHTLSALRE